MWMLVRANALGSESPDGSGSRTLAACPDSPERGDPWRWTISRNDSTGQLGLDISSEPDHIWVQTRQYADGYTGPLHRAAGTQLVIASLRGEALVAAASGPWERWLRPGDIFVVEGEEDEDLRLSLPEGDSCVEVVSLAPRLTHALRWVP
ncbi:hypothetical protein [Pseudarthrobacter sp. H2]|uniref:hypothetical protein n=1 Tax=Pseudarthrobacter sp. H2 TaxID=3418415 RepID=UPI003CF8A656